MGRALADASASARHVYEEIDDALSQSLSRLIFEGPESDLTLTENAQPALLATSIAVLRVLEKDGGLELDTAAAYGRGISQVYIGYSVSAGGSLVGFFWGFVDGLFGGFFFAWLYNFFADRFTSAEPTHTPAHKEPEMA